MKISIVIPIYNEEGNIRILTEKIKETLNPITKDYEIVFVDDGSRDQSYNILKELAKKDKKIKVVKFIKNFGQTAALTSGFRAAKGDIIISMDGDLQNDPSDIPRMIEGINRGYDVVCGWRHNRKDPSLTKKVPSLLASKIRRFAGDKTHDSGCTLKAYKKKAVNDLKLFGETHRFIPLILRSQGFKIAEIKVKHHPRKFGQTKYGMKRLWRGFFDLVGLLIWQKYATKPLHLFGPIGLISITASFITLVYVFISTFIIVKTKLEVGPLLLFSVLLFLGGLQIFMIGVIAEMQTKLYYSDKETYEIENRIN